MSQALAGVADMMLRIAFSTGPASNTRVTAQELTFEDLARRLSKPDVGEKDGSYYIRGGDLSEPRRGNDYLRSADLLILDGDKRIDPQTGEILNGAPPMEEVTSALGGMGLAYIAHTSFSYIPGQLEKWRIVIPAKLRHETDLKACVGYIVARLHAAGQLVVEVTEMTTWSQAWYVPRVRDPEAIGTFKFQVNLAGNPLSVSDAVFWYVTNEGEESRLTQDPPQPTDACAEIGTQGKVLEALFPRVSMIDEFNASHGLEWVRAELEARGYKFSHHVADKNQWRYIAPSSETGVAGVVVNRGEKGDWWVYSHHGGHDLLSHKPLDPFGLYATFYFGGDKKAASRALWMEASGKSNGGTHTGSKGRKKSDTGNPGGNSDPGDRRDSTDASGTVEVGDTSDASRPGFGGLRCNRHGQPIANIANVMTVLRTLSEWQGVFALDRFAGKVMLLSPIPDASGRKPNDFRVRPLTDGDVIKAVEWFQQKYMPGIGKEAIADAMFAIAAERGFDPLEDKLRSLRWDGGARIDKWLETYCGATIDDSQPAEYVRAVGACWLIAAVARALRPGCKVDTALVLSGPQGLGKSTVGRILAYDWFSDGLPPIHTKDASDHLRGVWIVEFGEMATATRSDVEELKAYLTRTVERFRPAYGRLEIEYPRRNVFFGTSNRSEFLKDTTGGRRFWPVKVTTIDTDRLLADRDQLWAEAVHRFERGERWHLADAGAQLAGVQQKAFAVVDERAELLAQKIADRTTVRVLECCRLLDMATDKRAQMEVADMLTSLGWERRHLRAGKVWCAPGVTTSKGGGGHRDHPDHSFG
jgi:predicted P-loop ATPase